MMLATALLLAIAPLGSPKCVPRTIATTTAVAANGAPHVFQNGEEQPLQIWWIDPQGTAKSLGFIAPGSIRSINTFVGHRFAFTKPDGRCVLRLTINDVFSGTYVGTSRYRAAAAPPGWHVFVDQELAQRSDPARSALRTITGMLKEMEAVLPGAALAKVRKTPIFLLHHSGPSSIFHPDPEWLVAHGRTVELTRAVEISDADLFNRDSQVQPGTLLHELAHAYYLQLTAEDRAEVDSAYKHARDKQLYRGIKRHDGSTVDAYALVNSAEYFAELTEAYFSRNDFFPFTRSELTAYDPQGQRMINDLWGEDVTTAADSPSAMVCAADAIASVSVHYRAAGTRPGPS